MNGKIGFDNAKYLAEQTAAILERVERSHDKLYLEFGGKLLFDYHAARVLPGYDPNVKMKLLRDLKDKADIILCIYAGDIERRKVRADFGITYDADALKLIDDLRDWGIDVRAVVITRFENQPSARMFKNKLERRSLKVYTHRFTKGYPTDVETIVSDEGYGANEYIETEHPLVIVTGPGTGQRQAGHLPVPALPRPQARPGLRIRQVRDLPHLEPAAQAPGQRRLRGGHGRYRGLQPDRSLPPGGLRQERRQL